MIKKIIKYKKIICLAIIIVIGAIIRVTECKWGLPLLLHGDESTVVEGTIDCIRRHSLMPTVFFRPDHFEVLCNTILFSIYSFLRYGVSAAASFANHTNEFYLIARLFTAFFGIMMIPLAYLISEKVKKNTGLIAAVIVAFLPGFVRNCRYATPDIPLTFMLMAVVYFGICYLQKSSFKNLLLMCIFTSLAFTIKYPGAMGSLVIAAVVIMEAIEKKKFMIVIKKGIISLLLVALGIFVISPSLYINIGEVYVTLFQQVGTHHLGADGLGYFGNMWYYVKEFNKNYGIVFNIFIIIGIYSVIKNKNKYAIPVLLGSAYWIILSKMVLHWERWGVPMYITPVCFAAIGIYEIFALCSKEKTTMFKSIKVITCVLLSIIGLNVLTTNIADVYFSVANTSRYASKEYCDKNSITPENTIYDGYSPLLPTYATSITFKMEVADGKLNITDKEFEKAKYVILSSDMYDRYYAEPDVYKTIIKVYDAVDDECTLIKEYKSEERKENYSCINSIINNVKYISKSLKKGYVGNTIKIYKINK